MVETTHQILTGVMETLLVTLYLRGQESKRPDALIRDEKAVEIVKQMMDEGLYDFNRIKLLHLSEASKLVIILRNRQFDRYTMDFLKRHPDGVVVHIGCGLDTRFERVAPGNGLVEWFDLDFPEVIEIRQKLFGEEGEHHHLLGCSILDDAWIKPVSIYLPRPFLFVAEGVSMHLNEEENKSLVRKLHDHFLGSELVFDAFSPFHNWVSNLKTARFGFRTHWGIWSGHEIEKWIDGIQLLDEWGYLDSLEPRSAYLKWLRPFEYLARTMRIYHFKLG
jgi:O-methyltransferase involved in polyketide biosynthesis